MSTETVIQAWFRFLHIVGKPIDFSDTISITKALELKQKRTNSPATPQQSNQKDPNNFSENTLNSSGPGSANFPCVKKLPVIFLEAIRGVSRIVDSFLGIYLMINPENQQRVSPMYSSPTSQKTASSTSSVSQQQQTLEQKIRSSRASMIASNSNIISPASSFAAQEPKLNAYHICRPSVNSILHLVGNWLFEASIKYSPETAKTANPTADAPKDIYSKLQAPSREFILGQAEAYGILCKIICSKKTNEKILPEYLSRFYTIVLVGLKVPGNFGDLNSANEYESGEILASIIVNGSNMFKLDLDGVNILYLPMLNALNAIFKLKYIFKEEQRG